MQPQSPQHNASRFRWPLLIALVAFCFFSSIAAGQEQRWPAAKSNNWYAHQPWLVGSNFAPSTTWSRVNRIQLEEFDVISFHNYGWPEDFEQHVGWLERLNRPIFCTEYMARSMGSTFDAIMPIARNHHMALINWDSSLARPRPIFPGTPGRDLMCSLTPQCSSTTSTNRMARPTDPGSWRSSRNRSPSRKLNKTQLFQEMVPEQLSSSWEEEITGIC